MENINLSIFEKLLENFIEDEEKKRTQIFFDQIAIIPEDEFEYDQNEMNEITRQDMLAELANVPVKPKPRLSKKSTKRLIMRKPLKK